MPLQHVVVSGVSGSGKSTIAKALAERHGLVYLEADDLHPAENVAKMSAGIPLDDADRLPWLESVRDAMTDAAASGQRTAVACSALRREYRDILRGGPDDGPVVIVQLTGSQAELAARLGERHGHFMPASLLPSQLATLEPLADDELGVTVPIGGDSDAVVARVEAALAALPSEGRL